MKKEDFMSLLTTAKEDEHGRLYVKGKYGNKVYFGVMTTLCKDLFMLGHFSPFSDRNTDELYDLHFWNDDTFEAHVISKHDLGDMAKEVIGLNEKEL